MDATTQQMDILGGWEFKEQAEAMLKQVGIPSSGHLVGKMSGGQKRRVALAAALLASPDLIIADEPTNHMDHQVMTRCVSRGSLAAGDRLRHCTRAGPITDPQELTNALGTHVSNLACR